MQDKTWLETAAFCLNESSDKEQYEELIKQAIRKKDANIPKDIAGQIFDLNRLSVSKIVKEIKGELSK